VAGAPFVIPDAQFEHAGAKDVVQMAQQIIMRRARQRRLFDQELILKVPTTPETVEQAGDILERFVQQAGYSEEDVVALSTTIREAIGNAAEHGNKNAPERTIHLNYLRTNDRVTIVVTDEGPGFDTEAFLARADEVSALEHTRSRRDNEARPGGLGVFLMKKACDDIVFNDAGNSIYLMKYLPGCKPS
jgi:serine/threonine-protein kinase RsbW